MNQFRLLGSRRFLPLFLTQFLGALNDNVYRFALVIFITFEAAGDGARDATLLVVLSGGIFILPFLLFSSVAGQLSDRHEKSSLIRLNKACEVMVMAAGAVSFYLGNPVMMLFVLFLMGTQSAFFGPLKYGILPQHLSPDELTGGNALIQMATYIAILGGASLGGLLAAASTTDPLPTAAAVVALALTGYLCARQIPEAPAGEPALAIDWHLLRATWQLVREDLASPQGCALLISVSWFWFLGACFLSLVPSYGKVLLAADAQSVTLLNAAFTLGIGCGSLLCETLSRRKIELGLMIPSAIGLSLGALGVWLIELPVPATPLRLKDFAGNPQALELFCALVALGALGALYVVPLNAAVQARAAPARRSRVIASLNVLNAFFMVGSALYTALLFSTGLDIPGIFLVTAGLNLLVLGWCVKRLPETRQRLQALLSSAR